MLPDGVRTFLAEPAVPDPPRRVWRDWVLVTGICITAVLETLLRNDEMFIAVSRPAQWVTLAGFLLVVPIALLFRRTHPLPAMAATFAISLGLSVVIRLIDGAPGSLYSSGVVLVTAYAVYRWGSGRNGLFGGVLLLIALVVGNAIEPDPKIGDVIGGTILLSLVVVFGLMVRFGRSAAARRIAEARSLERVALARELHDTVAHHVSAIAVQAQAGRVIAATDPARAIGVLGVIEEAASRTLEEMRGIVDTLRVGAVDIRPQVSLAEIAALSGDIRPESPTATALRAEVQIDDAARTVTPALGTAIYRIAQESITNAVRHASRASVVNVKVTANADTVQLRVIDNGGPVTGRTGEGFGVIGMAERAHLLGGQLTAGPCSTGWQVYAELPRLAAAT